MECAGHGDRAKGKWHALVGQRCAVCPGYIWSGGPDQTGGIFPIEFDCIVGCSHRRK